MQVPRAPRLSLCGPTDATVPELPALLLVRIYMQIFVFYNHDCPSYVGAKPGCFHLSFVLMQFLSSIPIFLRSVCLILYSLHYFFTYEV